ncbi:CoA-binding protein [Varunaivibrio sulfuroxidans]|uniref:Putative CoA-binding protein n=1 Tax=Varunaivibrio sulfuroxidans TaxID=1773489 RepID=A0A4R3JER7_9PROT|nr:CoA-binding protein [Varunaivibrio sulfuroxidans]TCS64392.1 putative CoA-binding protein [Varunaivibrio sulfuroxidans]WES31177.1 CoA-binding protein [Varunaivibrio sulfuroxidans]
MNASSSPTSDDLILGILETVRTIALIGASAKPERPSYQVMNFLLSKGYVVHPVNPGLAGKTLLNRPVFGALSDIPGNIDMVDIFRASEAAGNIIDEAISVAGAKEISVIWMQLGVKNAAARERAEAAGLVVIENRCPKIEYGRLMT